MPEQKNQESRNRELPLEIGYGIDGIVHYEELHFEQDIVAALSTSKFGWGGFSLGMPEPKTQGKKRSYLRVSNEASSQLRKGTHCEYVRLPTAKVEEPEDWNDYTKIIELCRLVNGYNIVTFQKYQFSLIFQYTGSWDIAKQATEAGFDSFKDMVMKKNTLFKDREPEIEPYKPNKYTSNQLIITFGSKEDGLSMDHEFALMDEILVHFLPMQQKSPAHFHRKT